MVRPGISWSGSSGLRLAPHDGHWAASGSDSGVLHHSQTRTMLRVLPKSRTSGSRSAAKARSPPPSAASRTLGDSSYAVSGSSIGWPCSRSGSSATRSGGRAAAGGGSGAAGAACGARVLAGGATGSGSGGGAACGADGRVGFLGMAATLLPPFVRGDSPDGPGRPGRLPCYSHSMVAGGLLLMS